MAPPEPIFQRTVIIRLNNTAAQSKRIVDNYLLETRRGKRIDIGDAIGISVSLGSSLWFRVSGLLGTPGRRLPIVVDADVIESGAGSKSHLRMRSNEGYCSLRLTSMDDPMRQAFDKAFDLVARDLAASTICACPGIASAVSLLRSRGSENPFRIRRSCDFDMEGRFGAECERNRRKLSSGVGRG
jgi:hypothetical protein